MNLLSFLRGGGKVAGKGQIVEAPPVEFHSTCPTCENYRKLIIDFDRCGSPLGERLRHEMERHAATHVRQA